MTELLGIEYPIQCGTMMSISKPELVAAVANAGGLACLAAAIYPTPEESDRGYREDQGIDD